MLPTYSWCSVALSEQRISNVDIASSLLPTIDNVLPVSSLVKQRMVVVVQAREPMNGLSYCLTFYLLCKVYERGYLMQLPRESRGHPVRVNGFDAGTTSYDCHVRAWRTGLKVAHVCEIYPAVRVELAGWIRASAISTRGQTLECTPIGLPQQHVRASWRTASSS